MTGKRIVLTTAGSKGAAEDLAWALVERKLAACVNMVESIESVYRWKGEVQRSKEVLLIIKTTDELFDDVRNAIRELHGYELPECISFPIDQGSQAYLEWISENVRKPEE